MITKGKLHGIARHDGADFFACSAKQIARFIQADAEDFRAASLAKSVDRSGDVSEASAHMVSTAIAKR